MKGNDHAMLAHVLLGASSNKDLLHHRKAFLLGCVEPDMNPFTYMRGSIRGKIFHGHNAENSKKHIAKCLARLEKGGLHSSFSYFTFGTLMHYVADAFTFPHNKAFAGNIREHVAYEKRMHFFFSRMIAGFRNVEDMVSIQNLYVFFEKEHNRYCASPHTFQTDCSYILMACTKLFYQLMSCSCAAVYSVGSEVCA